jgi:hypothetical protein
VRNTALFATLGVGSLAATVVGVPPASAVPSLIQGPSSSQTPYLVRLKSGVVTKSVLTTGDAVDGYRMAGIPDGLGTYDNGDGTFTVLMNHQIPNSRGCPGPWRTRRFRFEVDRRQGNARGPTRRRPDQAHLPMGYDQFPVGASPERIAAAERAGCVLRICQSMRSTMTRRAGYAAANLHEWRRGGPRRTRLRHSCYRA